MKSSAIVRNQPNFIPSKVPITPNETVTLDESKDESNSLLDTETFSVLLSEAINKTRSVPAEVFVELVMHHHVESEFVVKLEAMKEVLKRIKSAEKEELRVHSTPNRGDVLGIYETKRFRSKVSRPYKTAIFSHRSLDASCSCPDYLKNSLGFCKHIAAVFESIYASQKKCKQADKELDKKDSSELRWNPIRPEKGKGEPLARVYFPKWKIDPKDAQRTAVGRLFKLKKNGDLYLKFPEEIVPEKALEIIKELNKLRSRSDPGLTAVLDLQKQRYESLRDSYIQPKEINQHLKSFKLALYPYQKDGVCRFFQNGKMLLGDDMGLGKTAQCIGIAHVLWQTKRVARGLIVVPASLKGQWLREWQMFSDVPVQIVDAKGRERHEVYKKTKRGFLIVNYEQVVRDLPELLEWNPDFIALDEAQRIKNWETKTALTVKQFKPDYRLILTGTPMENRLTELVSIIEWIDPAVLAPFWRLNVSHMIRADGESEVLGVKNLETIRERIAPYFLRRLRSAVLEDLPGRTDTRIPVELTSGQIEAHDNLEPEIIQLILIGKKRHLRQEEFLKLMQLLTMQRIFSNGLEQAEFQNNWAELSQVKHPSAEFLSGLNSPKLLELRGLINEVVVKQGRKVVVFSQWRRMLCLAQWAISGVLEPKGLKSLFFSGKESPKRRTENVVAFHDDPEVRVLLASDAGGVGLNLQRAANCCINIELPWNPAVLEQRIGRVYRNGQKQPVDVYNLVAEYGIESRILGIVGTKRAIFTGLFDGTTDELAFEKGAGFLNKLKEVYASRIALAEESESNESSIEDRADSEFSQSALDSVLDVNNDELPAEVFATVAATPSLNALLSRMQVQRTGEGGLIISAPPESAQLLGDLFEGFGKMLKASAASY